MSDGNDKEENKKENKNKKYNYQSSSGLTFIDAMEILGMLQKSEEDKGKIIIEVKKFIQSLFETTDQKSKEANNDSFRKKISIRGKYVLGR